MGTVPDTPAKFGAAGHRWKAKHLKILFKKKSGATAVETNLDAAEVVSGSNQATIFRPVSANDMRTKCNAIHEYRSTELISVPSDPAQNNHNQVQAAATDSIHYAPSGHIPLTGHPRTDVNVAQLVPAMSAVFLFCSHEGMIQYNSSLA